jgi:hypothetical protein
MDRGSRKHVLDWTNGADFCVELLPLIEPVRVTSRRDRPGCREGTTHPTRLETFGPAVRPGVDVWRELRAWWLAHERGAMTPNWDIAVSCEIEDRPSLILVEAKAHVNELSDSRKPLSTRRITSQSRESCPHRTGPSTKPVAHCARSIPGRVDRRHALPYGGL